MESLYASPGFTMLLEAFTACTILMCVVRLCLMFLCSKRFLVESLDMCGKAAFLCEAFTTELAQKCWGSVSGFHMSAQGMFV